MDDAANPLRINDPAPANSIQGIGAVQILIVEDDEDLRNLLKLSVERLGFRPLLATDGKEALQRFAEEEVDLIILDIMLPHLSGVDVCSTIRERSDVPILMLTALDGSDDIAHALSIGADEYITKPFSFRVLAAYIEALLRRISWNQTRPQLMVMSAGALTLDVQAQIVKIGAKSIRLTENEGNLLAHLMHNVGTTCSPDALYRAVWGEKPTVGSTALETTIRRLRVKIEENPARPRRIRTIKGYGYRLTIDDNVQVGSDDAKKKAPLHLPPAVGHFQLDPNHRQVTIAGRLICLSEIDFQLLKYFLAHVDENIDRPTLLAAIWQHQSERRDDLVIAAIQRLRKKIEADPSNPKYIRTIPCKGYRLFATGEDDE